MSIQQKNNNDWSRGSGWAAFKRKEVFLTPFNSNHAQPTLVPKVVGSVFAVQPEV